MTSSEAWRRVLLEWEAARIYHQPHALLIGKTHRNTLVEHLLPSLLFVKAVAVFDEAADEFIRARLGAMPNEYRPTLEGRITCLGDGVYITSATARRAIRRERNSFAHDSIAHSSRDQRESAIAELEGALRELDIVGARPMLEYYGERSALAFSDKPGQLGSRTFVVGVREDAVAAYFVSWTETLHRLDPNSSGLE